MDEKDQERMEQELPEQDISEPDIPEQETPEEDLLEDFNLDEIMKEFAEEKEQRESTLSEEPEGSAVTEDTVRIDLPVQKEKPSELGDTIRLGGVAKALQDMEEPAQEEASAPEEEPEKKLPQKEEPYSKNWEPEYEQPIGEYVPPKPIVLHPRSHLHELKRKLVAGPERRYYEISEIGFGKLQIAIFLSILVVAISAGATALYAMGMVQENRMKLMVFGQFLAMLVSALLGCYQLMDGVADIFRKRFSLNSLLVFTFIACCVDGFFCLQQLRVPCCAAFSLQVTMSLWGTYHKRNAEMGMMDTMRKANHLDSIVRVDNYHDGCSGLLRSEGQVEDFMDHYQDLSKPEKAMSLYALIALAVSIAAGVVGGVLHKDPVFGVQVLSVSLLAAVPVTSFITLTRPMAILERRLHKLGTVLCGWRGVDGMSRRVLFPIEHEDLFPTGACKLNGVKFYGDRDPDLVVAYCTALVKAAGSGVAPLFDQLLTSRNGRHFDAECLRAYSNGGIGGEVCGESVLLGSVAFLKEMGVEIPDGTSVAQAVYAAIDGEFSGVFAFNYAKIRSSAMGLRTLCAYRGLRPVLITGDFMLTDGFLRSRFSVNTRKICFPEYAVREELAARKPEEGAPALALITTEGLAPFAYAVTGARSLRTASWIGVIIHLLGGILGLAMMMILAVLGEGRLLTPANLFLYEMVWLIPGFLITEWTRSL